MAKRVCVQRSPKEKIEILKKCRANQWTSRDVEREYGVKQSTLAGWKRQYGSSLDEPFIDDGRMRKKGGGRKHKLKSYELRVLEYYDTCLREDGKCSFEDLLAYCRNLDEFVQEMPIPKSQEQWVRRFVTIYYPRIKGSDETTSAVSEQDRDPDDSTARNCVVSRGVTSFGTTTDLTPTYRAPVGDEIQNSVQLAGPSSLENVEDIIVSQAFGAVATGSIVRLNDDMDSSTGNGGIRDEKATNFGAHVGGNDRSARATSGSGDGGVNERAQASSGRGGGGADELEEDFFQESDFDRSDFETEGSNSGDSAFKCASEDDLSKQTKATNNHSATSWVLRKRHPKNAPLIEWTDLRDPDASRTAYVYPRDLDSLLPCTRLTETALDYCIYRYMPLEAGLVRSWGTAFYLSMETARFTQTLSKQRRLYKELCESFDWSKYRYVLLPVSGNSHWSFIIVENATRIGLTGVYHINSLRGAHNSMNAFEVLKCVLEKVHENQGRFAEPFEWSAFVYNTQPQQSNSVDCGVYVLFYMNEISKRIESEQPLSIKEELNQWTSSGLNASKATIYRAHLHKRISNEAK